MNSPRPPNQHEKATNGCWWHLLSWTVFYCFYSITSNWKVSQIFLRQLSDIYREEIESSQRCFSKCCCPASLICHYSQCVKHQEGCFKGLCCMWYIEKSKYWDADPGTWEFNLGRCSFTQPSLTKHNCLEGQKTNLNSRLCLENGKSQMRIGQPM